MMPAHNFYTTLYTIQDVATINWAKAVETLPEKDLFRYRREFFDLQF